MAKHGYLVYVFSIAVLCVACSPGALPAVGYMAAPGVTTPISPRYQAALAQADTYATGDALTAEQARIASDSATQAAQATLTSIPPTQTSVFATANAIALAVDADNRHATETATAELSRAKSTAVAVVTSEHIITEKTQIADDQYKQTLQITSTAIWGEAGRAESKRNFYSSIPPVALLVFLVIAFASIVHLVRANARKIDEEAKAQADAIRAEAEARAEAIRREADAKSDATAIQAQADAQATTVRAAVFDDGQALVGVMMNDAGMAAITLRERTPPPRVIEQRPNPELAATAAQPPMVNTARASYPLLPDDESHNLVKFLYRCIRTVGAGSTSIPRHDKLRMGAETRSQYVKTLEQAGLVNIIPDDGTYITGYNNLGELVRAVENGAAKKHSPTLESS